MPKPPIHFFVEEIRFNLSRKTQVRLWLKNVIQAEGYVLDELNFIFCSDAYLLALNQQYLDHDTYTDVITFDSSEVLKTIAGDIFISIDRVRENARMLSVKSSDELLRVMVHGTLHLLGHKDKSKAAKQAMTQKEDLYLSRFFSGTPA